MKKLRECDDHQPDRGMTIIEALVAIVILSIGSATVWTNFRTSSKLNRLSRDNNLALSAAKSEMENIRILPRETIHDTAYVVSPMPGLHLLVIRTAFDSARIMEKFEEVDVDQNLRPLYLRRPLEIQVSVRIVEDEYDVDPVSDKRATVVISLLKPDYVWY